VQLKGRGARRLYAQLNGTHAGIAEVNVIEKQIPAAGDGYRLPHAGVAAIFFGCVRLAVVVFAFHSRQSVAAG
jgi:hypothetical protein